MTTVESRFASPIDAAAFGEHRVAPARPGARRWRFTARIVDDGTVNGPLTSSRYHLYAGWFCPGSHRATIVRALAGLGARISVSYVDPMRDARGWAFRERTGPDEVNGFTLLRDAYEASDPGYDGVVTVPALWDRRDGRIVTNDPDLIDIDLATALPAADSVDLYPRALRGAVDTAQAEIANLRTTITRAVYLDSAKVELRSQLRAFDTRVERHPYLLGDRLTLADIRLWVLLVRYDAGPNATGAAGPRLSAFTNLWAYARALYAFPAFRDTTDFDSFTAPLTPLLDWTLPATRKE